MIRMTRCHYHHQHDTRHGRPMKRAMFKVQTVPPESMTPTMPNVYPIVKTENWNLR